MLKLCYLDDVRSLFIRRYILYGSCYVLLLVVLLQSSAAWGQIFYNAPRTGGYWHDDNNPWTYFSLFPFELNTNASPPSQNTAVYGYDINTITISQDAQSNLNTQAEWVLESNLEIVMDSINPVTDPVEYILPEYAGTGRPSYYYENGVLVIDGGVLVIKGDLVIGGQVGRTALLDIRNGGALIVDNLIQKDISRVLVEPNGILVVKEQYIIENTGGEATGLTNTYTGNVVSFNGVNFNNMDNDIDYQVYTDEASGGGLQQDADGRYTEIQPLENMGDDLRSFLQVIVDKGYGSDDIEMILPVELIFFTARQDRDGVTLLWATASEQNNDYFEVQYAVDGVAFHTLERVEGQGDSAVRVDYSSRDLVDRGATVYYRLRQVDMDGAYSYLPVVMVRRGDGLPSQWLTNLSGNPIASDNNLYMQVSLPTASRVELTVLDMSGKVVTFRSLQLQAGDNVVSLPVEQAKSGMLLLRAVAAGKAEYIKLIKQ